MKEPRPRPDTDLSKPAAWRWVAFVTLCMFVVSFWIPTVPRVGEEETTPFTTTNVLVLLVIVALAMAVVPASRRARMIIGLVMLSTTALAWAFAEPIRNLLGLRWPS